MGLTAIVYAVGLDDSILWQYMTVLENSSKLYCNLGTASFWECSVCLFSLAFPQSSI